MGAVRRVALIGNQLPRQCGIATFTHDLHQAVSKARPKLETSVVAMTDSGQVYDYPESVRFQIHEERIDDYARAGEFLNSARVDVVNLQITSSFPRVPRKTHIQIVYTRTTVRNRCDGRHPAV